MAAAQSGRKIDAIRRALVGEAEGHRGALHDGDLAAAIGRGAATGAPLAATVRLFKKRLAAELVDLGKLRGRGTAYLVFTSDTSWWLDYYQELAQDLNSTVTLVQATPLFKIYKLNPAIE
jgi:hypothetical protein